MDLRDLTYRIIGCAYKVHTALGAGLLESTYEVCLEHELRKNNIRVQRQVILPVMYDGLRLDAGYRIDLLVENQIILELKSVEAVLPIHVAQLMTYLKLSDKKIGYILNFNVESMKDGIIRKVM